MYQKQLFYLPPDEPEGFTYEPDFLTLDEEKALLGVFQTLAFTAYVHQEYEAKRRIQSYTKAQGYPSFLRPYIEKAATHIGVNVSSIAQAMVTEYTPGTQIGWHRDMPPYKTIIGISLLSAAPFRFRREKNGRYERITILAEPRSIYSMSGKARSQWQHSIPKVAELRYSITMRTV